MLPSVYFYSFLFCGLLIMCSCRVPILLGTNLNEWRYFVLPNPEFNSLNNQQYEALAKKLTKGIQPLVDYYTVSRFGSTALALSALETGTFVLSLTHCG